MEMIFQRKEDFELFYSEIKKCLFQTNFEDKFEVIQKIGSGKTSLVFEIKDRKSGMIYAAKFYSNVLILSLSDSFFHPKINQNTANS